MPMMESSNEILRTKEWFELAVPNPTSKNLHTQVGVHFEEASEMLEQLGANNEVTKSLIRIALVNLKNLATHLKQNDNVLLVLDRKQMLDAIEDQIVTAVGSAHMMRMDVVGGLKEVNDSNYSKFVDGKPIFDENMKIQKGPDHFKPDLNKYV